MKTHSVHCFCLAVVSCLASCSKTLSPDPEIDRTLRLVKKRFESLGPFSCLYRSHVQQGPQSFRMIGRVVIGANYCYSEHCPADEETYAKHFDSNRLSDSTFEAKTIGVLNSRYHASLTKVSDHWAVGELKFEPFGSQRGLIQPLMAYSLPGESLLLWQLEQNERYKYRKANIDDQAGRSTTELEIEFDNEPLKGTIRSYFDALGRPMKHEFVANDTNQIIVTVIAEYKDEQSAQMSKYVYSSTFGNQLFEFDHYQPLAHDDSRRAWISYYKIPEPKLEKQSGWRLLTIMAPVCVVVIVVFWIWKARRNT